MFKKSHLTNYPKHGRKGSKVSMLFVQFLLLSDLITRDKLGSEQKATELVYCFF